MNLVTYLKNLLYRYECVIIPNFGGFVTNKVSAKIDTNSNHIFPPTKHISFNNNLTNNDGLLANYIASVENISFEKASNTIALTVIKWEKELLSNPLHLKDIGVLKLNSEHQIIFEPNTKENFLTASFGLQMIETPKFKNLISETTDKNNKRIPLFFKYAASVAILFTLGFSIYTNQQRNLEKEIISKQHKALEKKIQTATFVIENPLPTIDLKIAKEISKPFHVIAGAFQISENAFKKVATLRKKGYDANTIGVNSWGLTQVAYGSFSYKNDAINYLYNIQKTVSKDAWLLTKK